MSVESIVISVSIAIFVVTLIVVLIIDGFPERRLNKKYGAYRTATHELVQYYDGYDRGPIYNVFIVYELPNGHRVILTHKGYVQNGFRWSRPYLKFFNGVEWSAEVDVQGRADRYVFQKLEELTK